MPDNSLIFEFCRQGNLNAVRQLISQGQGSIRDVNSWGETPLHACLSTLYIVSELAINYFQIAAANCNYELCTFLVDQGADREVKCYWGWSITPFIC